MRPTLLALALLSLSCASRRAITPVPALTATPTYLDLRPGVRLSVEKAYYVGGMPERGLNGFLGTRVATFGVQANGALKPLSLDSKPFQGGAAAQLPADQLLPSSMRGQRRYRFFYAVAFARSSQPSASVLLGAGSAKEIDELSAQLRAAPDRVCSPQSVRCTVFPATATVSISMEIVVNGVAKVVLWGSSLGSVTGGQPASALERMSAGHFEPVKLDGEPLRTPLLPGDRVRF
jgi:hypothetical protein